MKITLKLSLLSMLLLAGSVTQTSSDANYSIKDNDTRTQVENAFKSLESKDTFKARLGEYLTNNCRKGLESLITDALEDQKIGLSKKFLFTPTNDSFIFNSYGIPGRNALKIAYEIKRREKTVTKTICLYHAETPHTIAYIAEFTLHLKPKATFELAKATKYYSANTDIQTASDELADCPATDDITENSLFTNIYNSCYLEQTDREQAKRYAYIASGILAADFMMSKFVDNGLLGFAIKGRNLGLAMLSKTLPWNKS